MLAFLNFTEGAHSRRPDCFLNYPNKFYNMKTNQRFLIVAIEVEVIR